MANDKAVLAGWLLALWPRSLAWASDVSCGPRVTFGPEPSTRRTTRSVPMPSAKPCCTHIRAPELTFRSPVIACLPCQPLLESVDSRGRGA